MAFHVTFIKARSNISSRAITDVMDAFLALSNELGYVIQLTTGTYPLKTKNIYRSLVHASILPEH